MPKSNTVQRPSFRVTVKYLCKKGGGIVRKMLARIVFGAKSPA